MTLHYRHGLLKPHRAPAAREQNAAWLGPDTLGIEVTEPELAAGCGLGNVDPQHLGGNLDTAAVDAAISWPVPPADAKLVTIRPDADAFGAMALLNLRANGVGLSQDAHARIALVSHADRFAHGRWPGQRPLPTRIEEIDEVGVGAHNLGVIIAGLAQRETTIETGIQEMMRWILTGAVMDTWIALATKSSETLFSALRTGLVSISDAKTGEIALVEGFVPGALRIGYRRAPVVVAIATLRSKPDQTPRRKITIAQWKPGYVDLSAAARALSLVEPGWGGSAGIIGSPQGVDSTVSVDYCLDVLQTAGALGPPPIGE